MRESKLYKKIINTNFNLFSDIEKKYEKIIEQGVKPKKFVINPLDYELLLLEVDNRFSSVRNNYPKATCIFGIEIIKDYRCNFGSWYFST